jgi:hypothetical protein
VKSVYGERLRKKLAQIYRIRDGVRFCADDDSLERVAARNRADLLRSRGRRAFVEANRMLPGYYYVFVAEQTSK